MKRVISGALKLSSSQSFTEKRHAAAASRSAWRMRKAKAHQLLRTREGHRQLRRVKNFPTLGLWSTLLKVFLFSLCKCATIIPAVGPESQRPMEKNISILILLKNADLQRLHQSTKCITDPPLTGAVSLDTEWRPETCVIWILSPNFSVSQSHM